MKLEIILIVFLVQNISAWLFDLDLNLNSALRPGGAYTANKGSYLQDSFRSDVLAPTMMGIEKELKANRQNDFIVGKKKFRHLSHLFFAISHDFL